MDYFYLFYYQISWSANTCQKKNMDAHNNVLTIVKKKQYPYQWYENMPPKKKYTINIIHVK
jgi:hypothetical protein